MASLVPPRRRRCCGWPLCPASCWFTVMMLGRQQGPRVPALATPSRTSKQENGEIPLFPQECVRVSPLGCRAEPLGHWPFL